MSASVDIARLMKQAEALMKSDLKGAIGHLDSALSVASGAQAIDVAMVAEELARAWARRKSPARSLYYASMATEVAPERKAAWNTLAKTCELVATRIRADNKKGRARALFRIAATAFKKAAALSKDAEDKRWLMELARDASANAATNS
jgi:hypothetical protein